MPSNSKMEFITKVKFLIVVGGLKQMTIGKGGRKI